MRVCDQIGLSPVDVILSEPKRRRRIRTWWPTTSECTASTMDPSASPRLAQDDMDFVTPPGLCADRMHPSLRAGMTCAWWRARAFRADNRVLDSSFDVPRACEQIGLSAVHVILSEPKYTDDRIVGILDVEFSTTDVRAHEFAAALIEICLRPALNRSAEPWPSLTCNWWSASPRAVRALARE